MLKKFYMDCMHKCRFRHNRLKDEAARRRLLFLIPKELGKRMKDGHALAL